MSKVGLDTIEQFRRLAPTERLKLAKEFGLIEADDGEGDNMHVWLLRANNRGIGDSFGRAVQLAPQ